MTVEKSLLNIYNFLCDFYFTFDLREKKRERKKERKKEEKPKQIQKGYRNKRERIINVFIER